MTGSGYYPAGAASDPAAPYNEPIIPERDFEVEVIETLSRVADVATDRYTPCFDEEDGHTYADTDDTPWNDVYQDNFLPLAKLFDALKEELSTSINDIGKKLDLHQDYTAARALRARKRHLLNLLGNLDGWQQDSIEVSKT